MTFWIAAAALFFVLGMHPFVTYPLSLAWLSRRSAATPGRAPRLRRGQRLPSAPAPITRRA